MEERENGESHLSDVNGFIVITFYEEFRKKTKDYFYQIHFDLNVHYN